MKIHKLNLFTNDLEKTKTFYKEILSFDIIDKNNSQFSVQIGWTKLNFIKSEEKSIYHFSFLVAKNQFEKAFDWIKEKVEILNTEPNNQFAFFESWNAKSFYFFDGSNNLCEIISHYNLDDENDEYFNQNSILGISEIGLPTTNIKEINTELESKTTSKFWKGDFETFGTNGSDEGKILLPNYNVKKTWFPTDILIEPTPFTVIINNDYHLSELIFDNNKLNISNLAIL